MDDDEKLQKETEYKQPKMIVRKLIKKSRMQHYHEALNNAKKSLRQLDPTGAPGAAGAPGAPFPGAPAPGKSKQNKCNFQNPTIMLAPSTTFLQQQGRKRTTT